MHFWTDGEVIECRACIGPVPCGSDPVLPSLKLGFLMEQSFEPEEFSFVGLAFEPGIKTALDSTPSPSVSVSLQFVMETLS